MTLRFCAGGKDLAQLQVERDCTNTRKPSHDGVVLVWLRVHNTTPQVRERDLAVSPYYHSQIDVYRWQQGEWLLSQQGGSSLGGRAVSASLGGHRFALTLPPGDTQWLVRVQSLTPKIPHIWMDLEDRQRSLSNEQLWLALHIGMVLMLLLLVLIGWAIKRTRLQFRLMVLTALVPVSVLIGSGAIYQLWPQASPYWWGSVVFSISHALRLTCLPWIYETMVSPYQQTQLYRHLNRLIYACAGLTMMSAVAGWQQLSWLLILLLMVLAPTVPALGLYTAVNMLPHLKRILYAYLAGLLVLSVGAIAGMALTQGHSNLPVYISRVIDLSLPLGMLVTVLLRNKVIDREYKRIQAVLDAQTIALESERQSRREKRMLLDMLTHEIKNPLASISFAISSLSQSQEGRQGQAPRRLQNITSSVETIDQIIERCNLANGIEDERISPRLESVNLPRLLQDLISSSLQAARLSMPTAVAQQLVRSDPYLLRVIAANLIDNALKYASPNSTVLVESFVNADDKHWHWGFRVSNAIEPSMQPDPEQVFKRYYRHPLAQQLRGSGLGLSICRQICQLLGGQIRCDCRENHITFEVRFEVA